MDYLQADIGIACGDTRLQLDLLPTCLNPKAITPRHSRGARAELAELSNVITSSDSAMSRFPEDSVRSLPIIKNRLLSLSPCFINNFVVIIAFASTSPRFILIQEKVCR